MSLAVVGSRAIPIRVSLAAFAGQLRSKKGHTTSTLLP